MIQKKAARLRRARQTRAKQAELKAVRLTVHHSNFHIYAQLIDGSGSPARRADVAVTGDRITAVGDLAAVAAARTVDCTGKTITPGFIDIHSHSDWLVPGADHGALVEPFVRQGMTTIVGGNCGVYEGTIIKRRAVLGAGTVLTRSTPVYDIVNGTIHKAEADKPLVIPEGAVVVPGSRPITSGQGHDWQLSLYAPVIVKYRDEKTDSSVQLEEFLR